MNNFKNTHDMKKIIFFFAFVFATTLQAQMNKFDQLFKQLENKKGITTLHINKSMLQSLKSNESKMSSKDLKDFNDFTKNIEHVKLIVVDKNTNKKIHDDLKNTLKAVKLEELMTINKDGNKVKFYTENAKASQYKNLLMDVSTPTETVYMVIKGNLKKEDIQKSILLKTK